MSKLEVALPRRQYTIVRESGDQSSDRQLGDSVATGDTDRSPVPSGLMTKASAPMVRPT
jgi:hypothetical protein